MDDIRKVESISTDKIKLIISIIFKDEDIVKTSKSIKEIGYPPLIVRCTTDGNYQLCSHPEIFKALILLHKKKVDCIVLEITEQQGKELIITSLLRTPKISPKQQESLVWTLNNEGGYKSHAELGRKLGMTGEHISCLCDVKEQREKLEKLYGTDVTLDDIPTETLRLIKSFSVEEQKLFCDRIRDKKIRPSQVRDAVKFLKTRTAATKDAILNGKIRWTEAKYAVEKEYKNIKKQPYKIEDNFNEPKKIQEVIKKEIPYFSSELYHDIVCLHKKLDPIYFENIKDETERKQADIDENLGFALHGYYMFKRGKLDETFYGTILKTLNLDFDTIEHLKEDGSFPQFQEEP